jgi:uncharacterized membrane protein (UPF0127 family)
VLPHRLRELPAREIGDGLVAIEARGFCARLLGLAFLRELPPGYALLIPRCSSVHTFGMRFPLDLVFIGQDGKVRRIDRAVRPRRVRSCRGAAAVIEVAAKPSRDSF